MEELLSGYQSNHSNWLYYSALLTIAVFFKFNRLWSLRNVDLLLLLGISPGLLMVEKGELGVEHSLALNADKAVVEYFEHLAWVGYAWLFFVSMLVLIRLVSDAGFKRRPRLEQNMNVAGMIFLGVSAIAFLMAKAATEPPPEITRTTIERGQQMLELKDTTGTSETRKDVELPGPTTAAVASVSSVISDVVTSGGDKLQLQTIAIRVMSILAHLAVISGLLVVGYKQFGDFQLGVAMSLLYLILPCTAFDIHLSQMVIPAAFIVWAIAAYRRPAVAGAFIGLACGSVFFPIFLIPVWLMFYWKRGALRFSFSLAITGLVLMSTLFLTSSDVMSFRNQLMGTIDWKWLAFGQDQVSGFWEIDQYAYRIPVFVGFLIMLVIMCLRSRHTLETLVADSAAIVVGTQFWYTARGGVYVLWYLPLLLLVVFRPRLTHLVPPDSSEGRDADVKLATSGTIPGRKSQTGAQVLR
ncbi:MAG: hypothetical protein HUJ26_15105 [Planctomycetaceae bacterium]|nr:hypothetical protein [Planctomycetaceae bacterium]